MMHMFWKNTADGQGFITMVGTIICGDHFTLELTGLPLRLADGQRDTVIPAGYQTNPLGT
jgi:hypothetical protein